MFAKLSYFVGGMSLFNCISPNHSRDMSYDNWASIVALDEMQPYTDIILRGENYVPTGEILRNLSQRAGTVSYESMKTMFYALFENIITVG
jgi:hypothetical protein